VFGKIKSETTTEGEIGNPDEYGTIDLKSGYVYIKGDCSGFKGLVTVANGATFKVKSRKNPVQDMLYYKHDEKIYYFDQTSDTDGNRVFTIDNNGEKTYINGTGDVTDKAELAAYINETFSIDISEDDICKYKKVSFLGDYIYQGKMFGGVMEFEEGASGGTATIDTSETLQFLNLKNGNVEIAASESDSGDAPKNEIEDITIGDGDKNNATVHVKFKKARLKNARVHKNSTLIIEDRATIENLIVDQGTLKLASTSEDGTTPELITITGDLHFGSTLNSLDHRTTEINFNDVNFTGLDFNNPPQGDESFIFCWNLTLAPFLEKINSGNGVNGQADYSGSGKQCATDYLYFDANFNGRIQTVTQCGIFITNCEILSGSSASTPNEGVLTCPGLTADQYIFNILQGAEENNLPIYLAGSEKAGEASTKPADLGAQKFPQIKGDNGVVYDADIKWEDSNAFLILTKNTAGGGNNGEGNNGNSAVTRENNEELLDVFSVKDVYDIVCGDHSMYNERTVGQWLFWSKSVASNSDFDTLQRPDVRSRLRGTVLGADQEPAYIGNNTYFCPTVFAGYYETDAKHMNLEAKSKTGVVGAKASWFDENYCLELICSYELMNSKIAHNNMKIKNHLFSMGMKLAYNVRLKNNAALVPNFYLDHSFMKTEDFNSPKFGFVNGETIGRTNFSTGINLQFGDEKAGLHIGTSFNRRFGGEIHGYAIENVHLTSVKRKTSSFELKIGAHACNEKIGEVTLEIGKNIGNIRGFFLKFGLSINM
jgi:hypothetical protein